MVAEIIFQNFADFGAFLGGHLAGVAISLVKYVIHFETSVLVNIKYHAARSIIMVRKSFGIVSQPIFEITLSTQACH
jgi:hypothetical protein